MPTFLPSAQFIRIVGALLIVVSGIYGAYFLATYEKTPDVTVDSTENAPVIITDNPLLKQVADLDSDQDGLRDWEEKLWKTSAMSKDTDGDGTTDGDEVSTNRNPLVKGPKDSIRETINLVDSLTPESLEGLTATERVAREFFIEYLSYKEGGKTLTKEEESRLLQSTLQSSAEQGIESQTYTEKDIKLATSDDLVAYKAYGNEIGYAITKNSFKTENELVLLDRAFRTKNAADLISIEKISNAYKGMLSDFLLTSVPKSLTSEHVVLLNEIEQLRAATHAMSLVVSDPIQSLVAIANYKTHVGNLAFSIIKIQSVLQQKNVIYTEEESGYVLMNTGKKIPQ